MDTRRTLSILKQFAEHGINARISEEVWAYSHSGKTSIELKFYSTTVIDGDNFKTVDTLNELDYWLATKFSWYKAIFRGNKR